MEEDTCGTEPLPPAPAMPQDLPTRFLAWLLDPSGSRTGSWVEANQETTRWVAACILLLHIICWATFHSNSVCMHML